MSKRNALQYVGKSSRSSSEGPECARYSERARQKAYNSDSIGVEALAVLAAQRDGCSEAAARPIASQPPRRSRRCQRGAPTKQPTLEHCSCDLGIVYSEQARVVAYGRRTKRRRGEDLIAVPRRRNPLCCGGERYGTGAQEKGRA